MPPAYYVQLIFEPGLFNKAKLVSIFLLKQKVLDRNFPFKTNAIIAQY